VLLEILATQSRGALLGVLAVLFVLGAARIRSKTVFIAGLVAAGLAQFSAPAISSRQIGGSDQGARRVAGRPFDRLGNGLEYGQGTPADGRRARQHRRELLFLQPHLARQEQGDAQFVVEGSGRNWFPRE
jgi:hypothetical protein